MEGEEECELMDEESEEGETSRSEAEEPRGALGRLRTAIAGATTTVVEKIRGAMSGGSQENLGGQLAPGTPTSQQSEIRRARTLGTPVPYRTPEGTRPARGRR